MFSITKLFGRKSKKISQSNILIFIVLLFIAFFALAVRIYNLQDNIFFSIDQARDAQRIWEIITTKNIKILGPETYIDGLFNSPLFYYLLVPIYYLSDFDPNIAVLFLIIINTFCGVFIIYYTGKILFKNNLVGIIAAVLWAIAFEQIVFSRHLSNAALMSIGTGTFFLGNALYLFENKKWGVSLSVIGLAFAIHMNIYLLYLVFLYPAYYFIYRPKIQIKLILINIVLFGLLLSSFALAELRFNFQGIRSLAFYMQTATSHESSISGISTYIQEISKTLYNTYFSFNLLWSLLLFIFFLTLSLLFKVDKSRKVFLLIGLFSTIPLFGFKSSILVTPVINTSIYMFILLVVAAGITYLFINNYKIIALLLLGVIFVSNYLLLRNESFISIRRIAFQPITLKDEKQALDYIYKSAKGENFSICTITVPLFENTVWSYLFHWYGKSMYGYAPVWAGQTQHINQGMLTNDTQHVPLRYLIIEPTMGIPSHSIKAIIYNEDKFTVVNNTMKFGEIVVQKRRIPDDKNTLKDSQNLSTSEKGIINSVISTDPRHTCYISY